MKKVGASLAVAAFAFVYFVAPPALAFGLRLGPFHLGVPLFGHRHHHHPLYMHGGSNDVAGHEAQPDQREASPALFYPARALPPIFQNVFWPAFSSPWPFAYDAIFTTAFAGAARSRDDCAATLDGNAMVERIRATIGPNSEQMERLARLGGAIGAAGDYLGKSCPTDIPTEPAARLQVMDSQIQVLTMAVDMIRQPLQDFEQSLTDEQRAKLNDGGVARRAAASRRGASERPACVASSTAIDWSIEQIDKSVQPTPQQQSALKDVQQAFGKAAGDLQAHCPTSMPRSAVARLEAIEARLDATWRAILSIQVALQDFETQLSDDQKNRLQSMTLAAR